MIRSMLLLFYTCLKSYLWCNNSDLKFFSSNSWWKFGVLDWRLINIVIMRIPISLKWMKKMKRKYDNYCGNISNLNMMLSITILFDPRHKLLFVEWVIEIACGPQWGNELQDKVKWALMAMFEQNSNVRKSRRNASLPKEKASGCSQLSQ